MNKTVRHYGLRGVPGRPRSTDRVGYLPTFTLVFPCPLQPRRNPQAAWQTTRASPVYPYDNTIIAIACSTSVPLYNMGQLAALFNCLYMRHLQHPPNTQLPICTSVQCPITTTIGKLCCQASKRERERGGGGGGIRRAPSCRLMWWGAGNRDAGSERRPCCFEGVRFGVPQKAKSGIPASYYRSDMQLRERLRSE